jgi:hypothetical protein
MSSMIISKVFFIKRLNQETGGHSGLFYWMGRLRQMQQQQVITQQAQDHAPRQSLQATMFVCSTGPSEHGIPVLNQNLHKPS